MSLPKPDVRVYLDAETMYWLRLLSGADNGGSMNAFASEILRTEITIRAAEYQRVAERLIADGRVNTLSTTTGARSTGARRSSQE